MAIWIRKGDCLYLDTYLSVLAFGPDPSSLLPTPPPCSAYVLLVLASNLSKPSDRNSLSAASAPSSPNTL